MSDKIIFKEDEEKFFQKCIENNSIPKNDALKQIVLKRLMKDFDEKKVYSEQEVNEIIKKHFEDYTTLRRELVNFGYMQRDSLKGEYKVVKKELNKDDYLKNTLLKRAAISIKILPDDSELMKEIEKYAKECCEKVKEDNWHHTLLVRKYALILADIEKADRQVVEISAILHDIGKYLGHEEHSVKSYELSKEFLAKYDIPKKDLIFKCILKHSSRYAAEENEIEVKVLQSADALGAIFDDQWQAYCRETMDKSKLYHIIDRTYKKINLESARKIAEPQIRKLKSLVE